MPNFVLSPAAYADLEDIDAYTLRTWGAEQRDHYIRGLFACFEQIAAKPRLGRARSEIAPGVRSVLREQHVVFYEVVDAHCVVLRVLHQRRDVLAAFEPEQPSDE